jgi:hypothetical protein
MKHTSFGNVSFLCPSGQLTEIKDGKLQATPEFLAELRKCDDPIGDDKLIIDFRGWEISASQLARLQSVVDDFKPEYGRATVICRTAAEVEAELEPERKRQAKLNAEFAAYHPSRAASARARATNGHAKPVGAPPTGVAVVPAWREHAVSTDRLQAMTFDPITFAVPGLIPAEGVTLLCSKPKFGKSWLMLDLAIAATADRYVLGERKPMQGDVLYLALEDSLRRLQGRMTKLLPTFTGKWPPGLTVATQWRRVDQGGLDDIRDWVDAARKSGRRVAFIAIDVLAKVRPVQKGSKPIYEADYEALTGLHKLAIELGVAIVVVHHTRKMALMTLWTQCPVPTACPARPIRSSCSIAVLPASCSTCAGEMSSPPN